MADAAPVTPAPSTTPPPNGAAAPGKPPPKPGPVVEVKPKPGAAAPIGERVIDFTDHNGQPHKYTEKELSALVLRGKSTQETLTKWDQKRSAHEKREADFNAKVERLKGDPEALRDFLESQGIGRAALEKILAKDINHDLLNDDQKALAEERRKREALEKQKQEREEQEQEGQRAAEVQQHYQELSSLFMESLKQAEIPEELAPELFPRMASLYRAVRKAGHTPDPGMFAQHLRDKLDALVATRAASLPLEKLEGFIGKRKWKPSDDAEEVELSYEDIAHRRKLLALKAKRFGTPGVAAAPVAGSGGSAGAIMLDGATIRNMPGPLHNAYYAQLRASPEELPGKVRRFMDDARKAGVKI